MEPARIDALKAKEIFYTGKPCKRGHDGQRYANSGQCVECERARVKGWHATQRALVKALREEGGND